jgi:hypothetical protein
MAVLDFLLSAAGGGIVAPILQIGKDWSASFLRAREAKIEAELLRARTDAGERIEASKAFANAQAGAVSASSFSIPPGSSPVMVNVFLGVEAFVRVTRPGLTWGALSVAVAMFWFPVPGAEAYRNEFAFMASTAFFFWFGERYALRTNPVKR